VPEVFQARASCADAAVALLSVPYEFWSLGLFVLIGAAMARVLSYPSAEPLPSSD
jgi:disulfide bond formation protein DsbB